VSFKFLGHAVSRYRRSGAGLAERNPVRAKRIVTHLSGAPRFLSRNCVARPPRQARIARCGPPRINRMRSGCGVAHRPQYSFTRVPHHSSHNQESRRQGNRSREWQMSRRTGASLVAPAAALPEGIPPGGVRLRMCGTVRNAPFKARRGLPAHSRVGVMEEFLNGHPRARRISEPSANPRCGPSSARVFLEPSVIISLGALPESEIGEVGGKLACEAALAKMVLQFRAAGKAAGLAVQ
jgi:hypothetical protein